MTVYYKVLVVARVVPVELELFVVFGLLYCIPNDVNEHDEISAAGGGWSGVEWSGECVCLLRGAGSPLHKDLILLAWLLLGCFPVVCLPLSSHLSLSLSLFLYQNGYSFPRNLQ